MMRFLKWAAVITGVLAGISVYYLDRQRKAKAASDEMDEYLMNSTSQDDNLPEAEEMNRDINEWANIDRPLKNALVSFGFENSKDAASFQEILAREGYSSQHDSVSNVVDVLYSKSFNEAELQEFSEVLDQAMDKSHGQYQGFILNE